MRWFGWFRKKKVEVTPPVKKPVDMSWRDAGPHYQSSQWPVYPPPSRHEDSGFDSTGFAVGMMTGIPISPSQGLSMGSLLGASMYHHSDPAPVSAPDTPVAAPSVSYDSSSSHDSSSSYDSSSDSSSSYDSSSSSSSDSSGSSTDP